MKMRLREWAPGAMGGVVVAALRGTGILRWSSGGFLEAKVGFSYIVRFAGLTQPY